MLHLLHYFQPDAILISWGPITIYWYGLFLILGMSAGIITTLRLSAWYNVKKETILDLAIWLILGGILGARIYEIFLEFPYYFQHPAAIIKIWEGGLAIHGAILGGILTIWLFAKKNKLSVLKLTALIVPGLAIGQSIGRWGNWFNQELFGLPTDLPWGIPIMFSNRPMAYQNYQFFTPTFLYESLGCFLIFLLLLFITKYWRHHLYKRELTVIVSLYLISYSLLRFSLEFIKIDITPMIYGWRWPQFISLLIIAGAGTWLFKAYQK